MAEETNKTITITEKQLQEMIRQEVNKVNAPLRRPQRVKEHTAFLRTYEGKPVVKYGNAIDVYDKASMSWTIHLPIYIDADKKPIEVSYLGFLNDNNKVNVKILKQTAKENITETFGPRKDDNQRVIMRDGRPEEFPAEVVDMSYEAEVEITDGELVGTVLTVPATALNV